MSELRGLKTENEILGKALLAYYEAFKEYDETKIKHVCEFKVFDHLIPKLKEKYRKKDD